METTPARIGLYGGSFDPVHLGHLLVAQAAREEIQLDRIFLIPAAQSPFKPERQLVAAEIRTQMIRLALQGWTDCEIDTQEIRRGGVSYTVETARDYKTRFPDSSLFYLIGADHVPFLPKWRCAAELAGLVEFVVIPRPGEPLASLPEPFRGVHLAGFPLGVSSSQIRARVRAGLAVDLLTGPLVAEAIRNNRLYL